MNAIDSDYDKQALKEIQAWKSPDLGWLGQAMRVINRPLDKAGDVVLGAPGIGDVIQRSIRLGVRLTKAKLAQVVPGVGAAVGGGFNTYFTTKVCDAAYYLYRERFLAAKYGRDVIEVTVEPAPDLEPEYVESDEGAA